MKKPFSTQLSKLLFAFTVLSVSASTAEAVYYPDFRKPFDFSLLLASNNPDLQTDNNKYDVSLDRISIEIFTLIEPQIQFGFISGSSNLSFDNDPASTGINLNGYHAGLAMRSTAGDNPQIGFHATYIYQQTKNKTARQTVALDWHEWAASIFGKITLAQRLELNIGWAYYDVDARHRATGDINRIQNLKLASGSQERLEIAWLDRSNGRVGLTLQRGSYQQVVFRFSRKFR